MNCSVDSGENNREKGVKVNIKNDKGEIEVLDCDICLLSIGRHAFTEGLQLDKAGISANQRGQVEINDHWQTNVQGVYAIGDAVKG